MRYLITTLLIILSLSLFAQEKKDTILPIQFSGVVVTQDEYGEPIPLPYTNVAILGTSRGTVSDYEGFFSVVALEGDTVIFSRIGYQKVEFVIPDTLDSQHYSWYQIMSQDNILLPEAVIYPWPSREHFKIEFLALDISNELRSQTERNLAKDVMARLEYTVPVDGAEAFRMEANRNFDQARYSGQIKPQNIFNIVAWKQFIDAWKRGDFKRKKDKDN